MFKFSIKITGVRETEYSKNQMTQITFNYVGHFCKIFQITRLKSKIENNSSGEVATYRSESFKMNSSWVILVFTFFYISRRKYWFHANFQFPVFNGFTRFGMS